MSHYSASDKDMIFEAYLKVPKTRNLLHENFPPTEPGDSFGQDLPLEKIPSETGKYLKQVPEEHRNKVIYVVVKKIKDFLKTNANSIYPGDYKSFRGEIAKIIRAEFPSVGVAEAGYSARKIQELLSEVGAIKDERNGKLRVTKSAAVVPAEDIDAKFKAALAASSESHSKSAAPSAPVSSGNSPAEANIKKAIKK